MMERALVKAGGHHVKHRMCLIKLKNLSASHSFQAEQKQNAERLNVILNVIPLLEADSLLK